MNEFIATPVWNNEKGQMKINLPRAVSSQLTVTKKYRFTVEEINDGTR